MKRAGSFGREIKTRRHVRISQVRTIRKNMFGQVGGAGFFFEKEHPIQWRSGACYDSPR